MAEYFHLTYDECRLQFLTFAHRLGATVQRHTISARGPEGQTVSIDTARLGEADAGRMLIIQSGTHGIEGFAGSAIQQQFLHETAPTLDLPDDGAVLLIHAVNPYGFAWWRRQNENNVDLNRNFIVHGEADIRRPDYVALHPLLCPDTYTDETERTFLERAMQLVEEKGMEWITRVISEGQYECPDGLYYGGSTPEESNVIVREIYAQHVAGAREALAVDLHTGLGEFGTYTLLSKHAEQSAEHTFLQAHFDRDRLEVTLENADPVTPEKDGMLLRGVLADIPGVAFRALTFELGTYAGERMIQAERHEHWLHLHGDRDSAQGREILWEHRECSCPDSDEWRARALEHGRICLAHAYQAAFTES